VDIRYVGPGISFTPGLVVRHNNLFQPGDVFEMRIQVRDGIHDGNVERIVFDLLAALHIDPCLQGEEVEVGDDLKIDLGLTDVSKAYLNEMVQLPPIDPGLIDSMRATGSGMNIFAVRADSAGASLSLDDIRRAMDALNR